MFFPAADRRQTRTRRTFHAYMAVAAVALLLIGSWLASDIGRSITADLALADHMQAVHHASDTVLSTLNNAEAGQRSYLLTGTPADLETYDAAHRRLDADLARLGDMLPADPRWAAAMQRIRSLCADRLAALDRTIALYQSGQPDTARDMIRTGDGRRLMGATQSEVGALQDQVSAMMAAGHSHQNYRLTLAGPIGMIIGAALLLGYLGAGAAAGAPRHRCQACRAHTPQ